jgi:uncharacterized membrane protein
MNRLVTIDFTKGMLVLFMVLYHWLNYFYSLQGPFYAYVRFVTPSFVFITGFLISHIQLRRYGAGDHTLPWRLSQRGLKLAALFVILNGAIALLPSRVIHGRHHFLDSLLHDFVSAYIVGNTYTAAGKVAAFYILVPLTYLLLLSAAILTFRRYYKGVLYAAYLLCLAAIGVLAWNGLQSGNLELISIGLLGLILGNCSIDVIVERPLLIGCAYILYTLALGAWGPVYVLQAAGAGLTLALAYIHGSHVEAGKPYADAMALLGKYSLFAYVGQIAILQILQRVLRDAGPGPETMMISLVAAVGLTLGSVMLLERARRLSSKVDFAYKLVFA